MTDTSRAQLFVVSGPSGSGKSTLCREAAHREGVELSISATTRARRDTEEEGKDYYFMTEEAFTRKIQAGEFLEYARVFDHYYGTPSDTVLARLDSGQPVVLEIDVQGAMQVFERYKEACGILVLPPNEEELRRRLEHRGQESAREIEKRLAKVHWEIEQAQSSGRYDYTIINDNLEEAIQELSRIVNASAHN